MTRTYYEVLGCEPSAPDRDIRRAYLRASLKHHPDKNPPHKAEEARIAFVEVGEAYDILKDPEKRATYDRELAKGTARGRSRYHHRERTVSGCAGDDFGYEAYREKFDTHVAGMSEEELQMAMGAAAVLGGFVGAMLGSRLGRNVGGRNVGGSNGAGGSAGAVLGSAGSVVGSAVASELASGFVRSLHEQSIDRVLQEEQRQSAINRGEAAQQKRRASWKTDLKDVVEKTMEKSFRGRVDGGSVDAAAASARASASRNGRSTRVSGASDRDGWQRAFGTFAAAAAAASAEASASSSSSDGRCAASTQPTAASARGVYTSSSRGTARGDGWNQNTPTASSDSRDRWKRAIGKTLESLVTMAAASDVPQQRGGGRPGSSSQEHANSRSSR